LIRGGSTTWFVELLISFDWLRVYNQVNLIVQLTISSEFAQPLQKYSYMDIWLNIIENWTCDDVIANWVEDSRWIIFNIFSENCNKIMLKIRIFISFCVICLEAECKYNITADFYCRCSQFVSKNRYISTLELTLLFQKQCAKWNQYQ